MSGGQTSELKELERDYEEVLDENCRLLVGYFREFWAMENGSRLIRPPSLIFEKTRKSDEFKFNEDEQNKVEEIGLGNGRRKVSEFYSSGSSSKSKSPPFYPQRVSLKILRNQKSSRTLSAISANLNSGSELESSSEDNLSNSSSESEGETQKKNRKMALFEPRRSQIQKQKQPIYAESSSSPERVMQQILMIRLVVESVRLEGLYLSITSHIFDDPVTLETAKPPWMDDCELRLAITKLCMSEILRESRKAVLRIERFWQEMNMGLEIQTMLSKPAVINGFVEILFNSVDPRVLRATVFLLCELGSRDKTVIQTLTRVDSDVECIVALFKNGCWRLLC
ncbi:putative E3 ubiquitin-protein ligase LIN [Vitis vinifera]|uniref:Putative E3 ubiquitin-protein ligase LIN n=1 Tax=Vitis vinifera TaxID=29760 RepID=A0A438IHT9_VITVI|nr:putative E3 ubiquitin-protein ligase LIN [Vitis vinifera]